uniref:Uncharacterized protein n=1 Tax=Anguilla anguilla TaxID=7936 RepID=A0A0E9U816_ANGAN
MVMGTTIRKQWYQRSSTFFFFGFQLLFFKHMQLKGI